MGKKRAKVKSEKKKDTTEEESEEEQIFVVEVITSARVAEDADGWEYRVKWKGFESEDDTWEPEENILSGCEGLLSRFWKEVGTDNDDYPPGAVVAPGDAWIVKERRRSAKAADSDSENEKTRKRRKHHGFSVSAREIKKEKKTVKKKNKELKNFVETLNDETSDEDTPLSSLTSKPTTPALETNDPSKTSDHDLDVPRHPSRKVRGIKRKVDVISGEGNRPGSSKASSSEPPRKVTKTSSQVSSNPEPKAPSPVGGKEKEPDPPDPNSSPRSTHSVDSLFDGSSSPPKPAPPPPSRKPAGGAGPRKVQMIDDPRLTIGSTIPAKQMLLKRGPTDTAAGRMIRKPTGFFAPPPPQPGPSMAPPSTSATPSTAFQPPGSLPAPELDTLEPTTDFGMNIDPLSEPGAGQGLHSSSAQQADAFLAGVMPQSMAPPVKDLLPSQTRSNLKPGLPRFVKKFKWSGELMMNTAKDRTDRVCDISLTEPAEPRPGAARFSVFFSTEEPPRNLTIAKLLPQSTLNLLRPACLPPAQVAKLGYQDEKDAGALSALAKYMASRRLMTYTSLSLDGSSFAILLIFPSSVEEMCRQFRVQGIQRSGPFVAVLIPWAVTGEKARKNRTTRSSIDRGLLQLPSPSPPSVTFSDRHHSVRFAPAYHRALRFLDLPKSVHDYISGPDHPCDIWHIPSDGTPNVEGFETKALRSILRKCRAVVVDSKPTIPRVVFVHVGSVRTLHRLPSLVDRRRDYASIRFYTYGTHPSVPPERWGHREIFPLGGIVTFSASVLQEHIYEACKLITLLHEHPLWACYITPSVLASVLRDFCGPDPLAAYDRGDTLIDELLDMLKSGQISLLRQAPVNRASAEKIEAWVAWEWALVYGKNQRDTLSACLQHFDAQGYLRNEAQSRVAMLEELSSTMSSLQVQQSIIESYRRYVVLTGDGDTQPPARDGFEWMTLAEFKFNDDYIAPSRMPSLCDQ